MKYDKDMFGFIKNNNFSMKEKEELILNLNEDEINLIKNRWDKSIKSSGRGMDRWKLVEEEYGVTAIDLLIELLRCAGNLSEVARRMGISRFAIKKVIESNETFFKIYLEIEEMYLDYVEWKLKELVDSGDRNAIQYFLNNRGNVRGYGSYEARRRVTKTIRGEQLKSSDFELG